MTDALEVTSSGPQTIQRPQGSEVILGCTYTPGRLDVGELDIEWSNVSPDMTQKDKLVGAPPGATWRRRGERRRRKQNRSGVSPGLLAI